MSVDSVYVWQRLVGMKLLDAWEERLLFIPDERRVISFFSGKKTAKIEIYFSGDDKGRGEAEALQKDFGGSIRRLRREVWWESQERRFYQKIGGRLAIASSKDVISDKDVPCLVIPATTAFGTGEHPTTRMCLVELVRMSRKFEKGRLLDVGTGSGILALGGAVLGFDVVGFDHDGESIRQAKVNAALNDLEGSVSWEVGESRSFKMKGGGADVVVANLFLAPILESMKGFQKWVKEGGMFILSGVMVSQEEELMAGLEAGGFQVNKRKRSGKWICVVSERNKG